MFYILFLVMFYRYRMGGNTEEPISLDWVAAGPQVVFLLMVCFSIYYLFMFFCQPVRCVAHDVSMRPRCQDHVMRHPWRSCRRCRLSTIRGNHWAAMIWITRLGPKWSRTHIYGKWGWIQWDGCKGWASEVCMSVSVAHAYTRYHVHRYTVSYVPSLI